MAGVCGVASARDDDSGRSDTMHMAMLNIICLAHLFQRKEPFLNRNSHCEDPPAGSDDAIYIQDNTDGHWLASGDGARYDDWSTNGSHDWSLWSTKMARFCRMPSLPVCIDFS